VTGQREHGTRACYVMGPGPGRGQGCRCDACTAANREANRRRDRMILYGRWQPFVPAGPVRAHLKELAAAGIGRKRVAKLAGVSPATLRRLDGLLPGRPATRHMRPETARAILAIRPGLAAYAASARIDPTGTRRRLQALVAIGWTQTALAARLGMTVGNFTTMLRRPAVTAGTARAVVRLYDEMWDRPAPASTATERARVRTAKRCAQRHGWAPPQAWDDGALDDPGATPAEGWQRPKRKTWRRADLVAEARELFDLGHDRRQAADRLGVAKKTLDAALSRATTPSTSTEEDSSMADTQQQGGGARTGGCDCGARPGQACTPEGDHLGRYMAAEKAGQIGRAELGRAIEGLDVIAPQVIVRERQAEDEPELEAV
jgi:hypothetical protein